MYSSTFPRKMNVVTDTPFNSCLCRAPASLKCHDHLQLDPITLKTRGLLASSHLLLSGSKNGRHRRIFYESSNGNRTNNERTATADDKFSPMVQQLTREGNILSRSRNADPIGDMQITRWMQERTRVTYWAKMLTLVGGIRFLWQSTLGSD